MAKGGRGGRRTHSATTNVQPTTAQAMNNVPKNVTPFTDADAQQLRDDMEDMYDPDVTDAIKLYISDSNPNGDGYSHSQNLNYKLDNGMALNPTEKFIDDNIQAGMHAIGKDTTLYRFCHDDVLKAMGIADYTTMSESQLQKALIGTTFKTTSYTSFSYDPKKSPFAPNAPLGGGREVVMEAKVGENTKVVFGAKKQAEVIGNKGNDYRVTGIRFDGSTAYPRNGGAKPRVVLEVETV